MPGSELRRVGGGAVITVLTCVPLSLVFSLLRPDPFADILLYALCVGLSIWLLLNLLRTVVAAWPRARRAHGIARLEPYGFGWPGWGTLIASAALSIVGGTVAGTWIGDRIAGNPDTLRSLYDPRSRVVWVAIVASAVMMIWMRSMYRRLARMREAAAAAHRQQTEARLQLLMSQLEPHMLFNTLGNVRALVDLDPPAAGLMLDRLISFLRATLGGHRSLLRPLADEFRMLEDYLALMQVRMGERLTSELALPAELAQYPVPALLLQPLVENAIKHGLEPKRGGGTIRVGAWQETDCVMLRVEDDGIGLAEAGLHGPGAHAQEHGMGIALVRDRLTTLYPGQAHLSIGARPGGPGTRVSLRLPWPAAVDPSQP